MTEETPTPPPTVVITTAAQTKPWYAQVSNYCGAAVGVIGNVLPYLTPDFLTSIGLSANASHIIGTLAALILFAYKEKGKPVTLDPGTTATATTTTTTTAVTVETPKTPEKNP